MYIFKRFTAHAAHPAFVFCTCAPSFCLPCVRIGYFYTFCNLGDGVEGG